MEDETRRSLRAVCSKYAKIPWVPSSVVSILSGVVIMVIGCATDPQPPPQPCYSYYLAPSFLTPTSPAVRRVVLLPMENRTFYAYASIEFRDVLVAEMRSAGLFEVVSLPEETTQSWYRSVHSQGRFQEDALVELAKQHQADAVVFSSLTDYHPYWPPRVGVKLHIVSTHEAVTLASIDGLWDAKNEPVALDAQNFYCQLSPKSTLIRPDTILYAPSYFQKFVAHQIVGALDPPGFWIYADTVDVAPTAIELPYEAPPAPSEVEQ